MKEFLWVNPLIVGLIHKLVIKEHGGLYGIRDEAGLESALARPVNLYAYGIPTPFELAAAYAYGITKSHPFLDGNKRTAFTTACVFLESNGLPCVLSEAQAVVLMRQLAADEISEKEFSEFLEKGVQLG